MPPKVGLTPTCEPIQVCSFLFLCLESLLVLLSRNVCSVFVLAFWITKVKEKRMKIQCEVCEKAEAQVVCCSDEAVLCKACDIKVHEANKLFQRHHRVTLQKNAGTSCGGPLCDICQERKGYFFCLEDRALLCNDCDGAIHNCNSHQRFLLSGVQVSDHSLTENSCCSTSFSSETYQIQSKASLNSHYSGEETEAGNSGEIPSLILNP